MQETYELSDLWVYDSCSTDKTSNYTTSGATLSYNTDHYEIVKSGNGWGTVSRTINSIDNFTLEYDVSFSNAVTNTQLQTSLKNSSNNGYLGHLSPIDSRMTLWKIVNNSNTEITYVSQSIGRNTWYHCVLENNNGNLIMKLYNGDTLVNTVTGSTTDYDTLNNLGFTVGWAGNAKVSIKNIIIKAL